MMGHTANVSLCNCEESPLKSAETSSIEVIWTLNEYGSFQP